MELAHELCCDKVRARAGSQDLQQAARHCDEDWQADDEGGSRSRGLGERAGKEGRI